MAGVSGNTSKKLEELGSYNPSAKVTQAQQKAADYEANSNPATNSQYGNISQNLLDSYLNRGKFNYNMEADPLYQQYKEQYTREGKNAMQDTIADAASLTGGYGNSYGVTAGSQAYQSYLDQLNDKSMQLSQLAYERYNQEGADMYNKFAAADGYYQNMLQDYYTNRNYYNNQAQQAYSNDYTSFTNDRSYWQNAASQESSDYWNQVSADQNSAQLAESQRQFDAELAENQRQFNNTPAKGTGSSSSVSQSQYNSLYKEAAGYFNNTINKDSGQYGTAGLQKFVDKWAGQISDEILQQIVASVTDYYGGP